MCFEVEKEATKALTAETPRRLEVPAQDTSMGGSQASSPATVANNTTSVSSAGGGGMDLTGEEFIKALVPQSTEGMTNVDYKASTKRATGEEATDERPVKKIKHRRGRNDPEPDWSASMRDKQIASGKNRSRHACDRCRVSPPSLPLILPTNLLTTSII